MHPKSRAPSRAATRVRKGTWRAQGAAPLTALLSIVSAASLFGIVGMKTFLRSTCVATAPAAARRLNSWPLAIDFSLTSTDVVACSAAWAAFRSGAFQWEDHQARTAGLNEVRAAARLKRIDGGAKERGCAAAAFAEQQRRNLCGSTNAAWAPSEPFKNAMFHRQTRRKRHVAW